MADRKITMGLIVGNRGFFPGHLAETGREEMLRAMKQAGVEAIVLPADQSNHGAIESYEEAKRCAAHFRAHADAIDGVIVTLPNFGDEPSRTPCVWLG
jgi:L-fucose isomerase-like protein